MKIVTVGFLKKVIDVKDGELKKKQNTLDQLNLAMKTRHNPFSKPIRIESKNPCNDSDLFMARFDRVLRCKKKGS